MPPPLLTGGRRRRRRARHTAGAVLLALVLAAAGLLALGQREAGPARKRVTSSLDIRIGASEPAPLAGGGTAPTPLAVTLGDGPMPVQVPFTRLPRSGLLFDLDTGRVLWRRLPSRVLPIASLTKMMTALVVVDRVPPGAKVRVTKEALAYKGSAVGVLPRGKWIGVNTMLHGLLLPSGNDAAIALAQRAARTVPRFVRLMNRKAEALGLTCTRFSSPDGFKNAGNHSCATDLAAIARALLREPRLARIVRRRQAVLPFPIKGGKLYLSNHNPLLRMGYPGTTGVKTGYTDAAGRCLVATARRGRVRLGVVLLHSYDPGTQARKLLDRGFRSAT